MDRRRFVKSVGCAGTLAAATQLPAGASCMDEMMRFSQNRPSAVGMGYVVLDKDKSFVEQVTQENFIYEIRYDFDLGGNTIPFTIPENCVLKFNGGSLNNGTMEGNNTSIGYTSGIIFYGMTLLGTWDVPVVSMSFFDFSEDDDEDNKRNFRNMMVLTSGDVINEVYFNSGVFRTSIFDLADGTEECLMDVKSNTSLFLGECVISVIPFNSTYKHVIRVENASNVSIFGGHIIGDSPEHDYSSSHSTHEHSHGIKISKGSQHIEINGTVIEKMTGDGIEIVEGKIGEVNNTIRDVRITHAECIGNNRQGISIEAGKNIAVRHCTIKDTSKYHETLPGAGIDIEPWLQGIHVEDVLIENCSITGVKNESILIQPNIKEEDKKAFVNNITLKGCTIDQRMVIRECNSCILENIKNLSSTYDSVYDTRNVTLKGCNSYRMELYDSDGLTMENCTVEENLITSSSRPVSESTMKHVTVMGRFDCQLQHSLIADSEFNAFEPSSCEELTVRGCNLKKLVEFSGADAIYEDNLISFQSTTALTNFYSRRFYGNTIIAFGMRLNTGNAVLEDNKFIFPKGIDKASGTQYGAIVLAVDGGKFDFSRNMIFGFDYMITKNFGNEDLKIYSDQFAQQTRNNQWYTALEGCHDVWKGVERVFRGGAWRYMAVTQEDGTRPTDKYKGMCHFDTTLGKPIWWNGTAWVDATGASV